MKRNRHLCSLHCQTPIGGRGDAVRTWRVTVRPDPQFLWGVYDICEEVGYEGPLGLVAASEVHGRMEYVVTAATDGDAALRVIQRLHPEIIP